MSATREFDSVGAMQSPSVMVSRLNSIELPNRPSDAALITSRPFDDLEQSVC